MDRLRALIERLLPWYDSVRERRRDLQTARVERRSEGARHRADRIIQEYQAADEAASRAGDRLVEEVRQ